MARLVLMCGLPGSGKTTTAVALAEELGALRLSPDEWLVDLGLDGYDLDLRGRVDALQWSVAERSLVLGQSVILENGFWTRPERDEKWEQARELGVEVELCYLHAPIDELWARVDRRNRSRPLTTFVVVRDDLEAWARRFEPPDAAELARFDHSREISGGPARG